MTAERHIELFVLKSAVITQNLRSVFSKERVGNARGALEVQADSLVCGDASPVGLGEPLRINKAPAEDLRDGSICC
ncbi:MAG: hypothetical protein AB7E81_16780 [Hyphomicrobiaceae bacterium]